PIISVKEDLIMVKQEEISKRTLENVTIQLLNESLVQKAITEEVKNQDLQFSHDQLKQSYNKIILDTEQLQKELNKQSKEKIVLTEHIELLILRLKNVEEKNLELQNSINEHISKQITLEKQNQDYNEIISGLEITLIESHKTVDNLVLQLKQTKLELDNLQSIPGIRFFHKTMFSLQHFIPVGSMKEILSRLKYFRSYFTIKHSNLFDQAYYLNNNPDIKSAKTSAIRHYILYGGFEGRNPSEKFDSSSYIEQYQDVKTSGINPLIHYLRFGRKEGRLINYNTTGYICTPVNQNISTSTSTDVPVLSTDDTRKNIPHFAPPVDDYSLLVPFNYQSKIIEPATSIAVVCHIFYLDLLDEIIGYISNIPYNFDLYISTDTPEKAEVITSRFNAWEVGKLEIRLAINRGRDIAPKLLLWPDVYRNYEYFLHIHTKKTIQENILFGWRTYLFETLLGSPEIIKSVFDAFISDQNLGIIAPQHYSTIRHAIGWGYNYAEASRFANSLGIKFSIENPIDFPSGSMFWARSKAILPLINSGITLQDFPEENGQIDNTLAHVIERLYFFVCEKAGYSWIKIVNPLQSPNAERCLKVNEQSELLNLINRIKTPLLQKTENNQLIPEVHNHLIKKIISGLKYRRNYFFFKSLVLNKTLKKLDKRAYYRKIFINSPYSDLDFEGFIKQIELHIAGKNSTIDFDEEFYLKANKDISKLVSLGLLDSGFTHFCLSGKNENRIWSNKLIKTKYQLNPNFPEGFFSPTNIKPKQHYQPILNKLEKSKEPFLLILFAHLQSDLFYAGYTAFFRDFLPVFEQFSKILISVESDVFEPNLAKQYSSKIEVVNQNQIYKLKTSPDVILCFSNQLFTKASKLFNELDKTVYYCQEYEAGFFPYGSEFIEAEKAIANSKNIIISTVLLKNFLEKKNLLNDKRIYVTSPKIEQIDIKSGKWNKLFFYFRPEYFHARNIPEILWETVHEFCQKHKGYEIYMVGSIETRFSFEINGNPVFVLNKLPTEQYNELIATCDVVIAMIYSAHPGVIAFQTAASGIPTVTNIFESRDQKILKQISENFVPYNPIKDSLLEKIELALSLPKGKKSFDQELYCGKKEDLTLSEFILKIWNH
ncbi:MAG: rhamnan synthesis F family protein, partial [Bacteroidales bacterium]